jgi:hypothetical protein
MADLSFENNLSTMQDMSKHVREWKYTDKQGPATVPPGDLSALPTPSIFLGFNWLLWFIHSFRRYFSWRGYQVDFPRHSFNLLGNEWNRFLWFLILSI